MTVDLSTLNAAQRDAVLFTEGPCLVIAGAGSGKTTILTKRIARLIEEGFAHPSEVLAVTFTNKAAKEMQARLYSLLGDRARGIWCSTFHSLCVKLIRANTKELGLAPGFTIYDADDAKRLIKRLMKEHRIDETAAKPSAVARIISDAKNRMTEPSDFGGGPAERAAVELWEPYHQGLKASNALDFDSLISEAIRLLQENPEILRGYQERFRYILGDENQDVNLPQSLLLKMLASKYRNLMVVGDEDQCLVRGTAIATPAGNRPIETLKPGDEVLTAAGRGLTSVGTVQSMSRKRYRGPLIEIETQSGKTIRGTSHHLMFSAQTAMAGKIVVYLMFRKDLGFRVGQVAVGTRGGDLHSRTLPAVKKRTQDERADRTWVLGVYDSKMDACYWENVFSYRYGIPQNVFAPTKVAGGGQVLDEEHTHNLFHSVDTAAGAEKLMEERGLLWDYPHHRASAAVRYGNHDAARRRRAVNVTYFAGPARGVRDVPKRLRGQIHRHSHTINLSSSFDPELRRQIEGLGYKTVQESSERWALRVFAADYDDVTRHATRLADLLDSGEIRFQAKLTKPRSGGHSPALQLLNLAAIYPGMLVPVIGNDGEVVLEEVSHRRESDCAGEWVYDVAISEYRNYIANGIVSHNCVYTFRGSDPRYILEFTQDWPEAITIKLEQNYRSTGHILDAANAVISNNENRRPKVLFTDKGKGHKVIGMVANDDRDEAWKVVREMERLMREERLAYSDFAVFYRTNAQSRQIEDAFLKSGTPYKIVGGTRYFDRAEVRDLMAYLKVLVNPADGISLRRIVNVPRRGIGDTSLNKLDAWARERGWTLWQAMEETALGMGPLPKKATESIYEFTRLVDGMRKASMPQEGQVDIAVAVQAIIEKTGMVEAYEALGDNESLGRAENVAEFLNVAIEFGGSHPEATLADFVEWLALRTDLDEVEEGSAHAVLMTVHTAKGLEFPCVFVTGLEEEVFPHINSINEGAAQLEEERRLAYVALSRAERHLVLLRARQRMSFGQIRYNKPSRFLAEIPPECLEAEEGFAGGREAPASVFGGGARSGASRGWRGGTSRQGTGTGSTLPRPAAPAAPKPAAKPAEHWAKGTRIRHKAFGLGTVTVAGTDSVEVRFDDGSRKKLMPAYAPMERIS